LKPFTDLDGKSASGILKKADIDVGNPAYVNPGEAVEGASILIPAINS